MFVFPEREPVLAGTPTSSIAGCRTKTIIVSGVIPGAEASTNAVSFPTPSRPATQKFSDDAPSG